MDKASFKNLITKHKPLQAYNLSGADFSGMDLSGYNLRNLRAERADFSGCNLKNASLRGAYLKNANFSHADLSGTDLSLSNLKRVDLTGAKCEHARFGLSSGLSKGQQQILKDQGAITGFYLSFTKALSLFIVPLALACFLFFRLTNLKYLTAPELQEKMQQAITQTEFVKALRYNQELINKAENAGHADGIFNSILTRAKIHKLSGDNETSLEILRELERDESLNTNQKARIHNDIARLYLEKDDVKPALVLLENIDRAELRRETLFMVEMSRALAYRKIRAYNKALAVYHELLIIIEDTPSYQNKIKEQIRVTEKLIK